MSKLKNKGFWCDLCPKAYATKRGYENHIAIHSDVQPKPSSGSEHPTDVNNQPLKQNTTTFNHFSCTDCKKTFKTKNGLEKHSLLHKGITPAEQSASTPVQNLCEEDTSLLEYLDDSLDENGEETYFERMDQEEELAREAEITGEVHENPPPPKKSKKASTHPALVRCQECGTSYKTLESFIKHNRVTHAIKEFYAFAPDMNRLQEECPRLAMEVLAEMNNCNFSVGPAALVAADVRVLLEHSTLESWLSVISCICEGVFDKILEEKKFMTPSQLREEFTRNSNVFMASECETGKLLENLCNVLFSPMEIKIMTLSSFMRRFCKKLLAFFMHVMIHKGENPAVSITKMYSETSQSVTSSDFKRNMHYIGGSNVRSVLRTGLLKKNPSDEWKRIIITIKTYFLSGETAVAPDAELIAWTAAQDRGKLIKISENALNFFVKLGEIVKPLEHFDGSLYVDEVMKSVLSCPELNFLMGLYFLGIIELCRII